MNGFDIDEEVAGIAVKINDMSDRELSVELCGAESFLIGLGTTSGYPKHITDRLIYLGLCVASAEYRLMHGSDSREEQSE